MSRRAWASRYDLLGNGRTALKAYYGRFYNQFGSELAEAVQPERARVSLQVPWTDPNSNLRLDPGELNLSTFTGFTAGLFPPMDAGRAAGRTATRFNVGVDHQLMPNFAVSVSYHRRQHRDGLTILDRARPSARVHAGRRAPTLIPSAARRRSPSTASIRRWSRAAIASSPTSTCCESDYDGVIFTVNKRMSNRWQLLAGLTLQSHEGFSHSGTFTNPGTTTDFNNPNYRA